MDKKVYDILNRIKTKINNEYGFEGEIPRINYGNHTTNKGEGVADVKTKDYQLDMYTIIGNTN